MVPNSSFQYNEIWQKISPNTAARQGRGAGVFTGLGLRRHCPLILRKKPMALTRDEVLHVADLARLSLLPEEIELFTRQLNDILAYVEKLQELDTEGVEPLAHVVLVFNVFREDAVRKGLDRKNVLNNAPAREEGAFLVPRII